MIAWTMKLPTELLDEVRRQASLQGVTASEFVRRALSRTDEDQDRLEDLDRRLARLEEMAGV